MQILVVDANFLMSAYKFRVDAIAELKCLVEGGFTLVTSSSIVKELKTLSKKKGTAGPQARFALEIMEKERVKVIKTKETADDWILEYCASNGAVACTNDFALRKKLRDAGVRSIALRGRFRLDYA
jgi:rRNA-processing protein FCF1